MWTGFPKPSQELRTAWREAGRCQCGLQWDERLGQWGHTWQGLDKPRAGGSCWRLSGGWGKLITHWAECSGSPWKESSWQEWHEGRLGGLSQSWRQVGEEQGGDSPRRLQAGWPFFSESHPAVALYTEGPLQRMHQIKHSTLGLQTPQPPTLMVVGFSMKAKRPALHLGIFGECTCVHECAWEHIPSQPPLPWKCQAAGFLRPRVFLNAHTHPLPAHSSLAWKCEDFPGIQANGSY